MTFRKLGMDRNQMGVGQAFGSGTGALVTGDITRGIVVTVEVENDTGSTDVGGRRTGAVLINISTDGDAEFKWGIVDSTLTVTHNTASTSDGTYTFWVF